MRSTLVRLRRFLRDDSGQALVLSGLAMLMVFNFAGLAIDMGQLRYAQNQLQTAADAAAIAGALEINDCGGSSDCTAMQTAAQTALAENGLTGSTLLTQCATNSGTGLTLWVNNGPCGMGSSSKDPNYGNANYVEAVVTQAQPTYFARIFGFKSIQLSARAEAGVGNSPYCLQILDPGGITFSDTGTVNLSATCGIMVNSSSNPAFKASGNATISATAIDIHGGDSISGSPTITPTPTTNVPKYADPLNWLNAQAPDTTPCAYTNMKVTSNTTLNPGVYCGGLSISGSASVIFSPGVYVMTGDMSVSGGSALTGTGVTFYFSSGSLTLSGSDHSDLVAPTTGQYAGVLLFQNSEDSSLMTLTGDSTSAFQGAMYLPSAAVTISGAGNSAAYTILDAYSVTLTGGANFSLGNDYSSLPNGSPAKAVVATLAE